MSGEKSSRERHMSAAIHETSGPLHVLVMRILRDLIVVRAFFQRGDGSREAAIARRTAVWTAGMVRWGGMSAVTRARTWCRLTGARGFGVLPSTWCTRPMRRGSSDAGTMRAGCGEVEGGAEGEVSRKEGWGTDWRMTRMTRTSGELTSQGG